MEQQQQQQQRQTQRSLLICSVGVAPCRRMLEYYYLMPRQYLCKLMNEKLMEDEVGKKEWNSVGTNWPMNM